MKKQRLVGFAILGILAAFLAVNVGKDAIRRSKWNAEESRVEKMDTLPDNQLQAMASAGDTEAASTWGMRLFERGLRENRGDWVNESGRILLAAATGSQARPGSPSAILVRGNLYAWRNTASQFHPGLGCIYQTDESFRRAVDSFFGDVQ